jgi:uncharacterized membrane protein YphA (DoxX/SURF4 family)
MRGAYGERRRCIRDDAAVSGATAHAADPRTPIVVATPSDVWGFAREPSPLRSIRVQTLFSAFPGRWPGAGLFLLRVAIGATLVTQGARPFGGDTGMPFAAIAAGLLALIIGTTLIVGFLTPVAGIAAVIYAMATAIARPPGAALDVGTGAIELFNLVAVSLAITFLGAGAFSVDSYLFGRREIVIPPGSHPHRLR